MKLQIEKVHTDGNSSDMLTKTLPKEILEACKEIVGMREPFST